MPPVAAYASTQQPQHAVTAFHQTLTAPTLRPATVVGTGRELTREVFGFATSQSLADPTVGYPSWNFDLLSTVAYFTIHVYYTGVLIADSGWTVWNSSALTGLVTTAHAHGVKVVVTIKGPGNFSDMCSALFNGDTTTLQIVNEVVSKGVDGVNIDYEGTGLGTCPQTNQSNQTMLTNFAHQLRVGLDNAKPGYYLSIDTYTGSALGNDGFFNIAALNPYVDSFFVMAYDMDEANQGTPPLTSYCSGFCMAPVSPMVNYHWNDVNSMSQYSALVGPSKVILGQPYYGRVACVSSPTEHAASTGSFSSPSYHDAAKVINSPDVSPGTYSIHRDPNDVTGLDRWDAWYDLSLHCWREMYWPDVAALNVRYDLVNQDNLRGVGFWTLNDGGGAGELWTALQNHFVQCTNATLTPTPASPQLSGTAVQQVASSGSCLHPLYEFWLLRPGGTWQDVQPYSSAATYNWSTRGLPAGTYRFSVWARDADSRGTFGAAPNTYDTFAAVDYVVTTAPCTAMSVTAVPPAAVVGTAVAVTGAATGCPNPSYEFWLQPPGGTWYVARPYSTSATFNWSTVGARVGTYRFSVWARDASSPGTSGSGANTYDAFSAVPYSVNSPSCPAITTTSAPDSTANVSTPVTITGAATGCATPLYEFWLLPPGGVWRIVQGYTSSATFKWSTNGYAAGSYRFSVWARDPGSSAAYDSFSAFQYQLTVVPCTATSAIPSPVTSATVGTPVTVTGAATGCPTPLYQFWLLPPGGIWTVVQPYSTSATFTWSTTSRPPGTYRFSVWARDASSSASYDAFQAFDYPLT